MKTVYLFRGAPASGKGTVIPLFCKLLPKPVALIDQDSLRWNFHLIGRDVSEVMDNEHVFANANTKLLYEQYLKNGQYTLVLEGLFTWDDSLTSQGNAKELLELGQRYEFNVKSIVLRANREELLARNAARPYAVPLNEFETLYTNVYKSIGPEEIVIDSTAESPNETLEKLKALIE